jgi:hypothetical protein
MKSIPNNHPEHVRVALTGLGHNCSININLESIRFEAKYAALINDNEITFMKFLEANEATGLILPAMDDEESHLDMVREPRLHISAKGEVYLRTFVYVKYFTAHYVLNPFID